MDSIECVNPRLETDDDQHIERVTIPANRSNASTLSAFGLKTKSAPVIDVEERDIKRPYSMGLKSFANISEHAESFKQDEYTRMRYTPVKCSNAGTFLSSGYHLRCVEDHNRRPRLMVVVTMYNETATELKSTLRKVGNNIQQMQQDEQRLGGFEKDVWTNICVVIVSDGRHKAHPTTLEWFESVGMYSYDAVASGGKDTTLHLFERTVLLDKTDDSCGLEAAEGWETRLLLPPMQMVFALKEKNAGKLDSHFWFFEAFCGDVQPSFTLMLDVGTQPTRKAFSKLLTAMAMDKHIGGVCGEIAVEKPFSHCCNFIVASQIFEYKVSNYLDKALESMFGSISVLPGAFSAYRYEAIRGAPLAAYFRPMTSQVGEMGPFLGNMYLAEDRILCFELFSAKNKRWTLKYLKGAYARTDVPTDMLGLISQRRRWINGAFFAALYALGNVHRVLFSSGHPIYRKFSYCFLWLYQVLTFITAWLQVGTLYLTMYYIVIYNAQNNLIPGVDTSAIPDQVYNVFLMLYTSVLLLQVILGLGNKPKHVSNAYSVIAAFYAVFMVFTMCVIFWLIIFTDAYDMFLILSMSLSFAGVLIGAVLHGEVRQVFMTLCQYLVIMPVSVNILTVYSICNLHDLSWGTKGLDGLPKVNYKQKNNNELVDQAANAAANVPGSANNRSFIFADQKATKEQEQASLMQKAEDNRQRIYHNFRSYILCFYIGCQALYIVGTIMFLSAEDYLLGLALYLCGINGIKLFFSSLFLLHTFLRWIRLRCFTKFGIRLFIGKDMQRRKDLIKERFTDIIEAGDRWDDDDNRDKGVDEVGLPR